MDDVPEWLGDMFFSDPVTSINMQLHYDNYAHRAAVDSSGIRMWLLPKDAATQAARPHRIGELQFGDNFNSYVQQSPRWLGYLPLGLSRYDFFCPGETTATQVRLTSA